MEEYQVTANQMKYLLTLTSKEEKKRTLSAIAKVYGVNKSTVSRSLASLMKTGILDEAYVLTPYGKRFIIDYKYQYDRIVQWLYHKGVEITKAKNDAFALLEGCSKETIQVLVESGEFCKACSYFKEHNSKQIIEGKNLIHYVTEGEYKVPFVFHKDKRRSPEHISMANSAFLHPATMIIRKSGSHLCLKMKKIKRASIIQSMKLEGKLESMKYENNGKLSEVTIVDDIAYIPMDAMKFIYIKEDNILQGYTRLTMTATVKQFHMPESSAVLTVYL